jgi:hypothetical protein
VEDLSLLVLITTDSLKVGNDFPNVVDVVVLNAKDPNDIVQKTGHAGQEHGQVSNPHGIIYVTKAQVERVKSVINGGNVPKGQKNTRKVVDEKMTQELAHVISTECFTSEVNIQFNNPDNNPPCKCETCPLLSTSATFTSATCNCSGPRCKPEPALPPLPHSRVQPILVPMVNSLTDKMCRLGEQKLEDFQWNLWDNSLDISLQYAPPSVVLPDLVIKNILNHFAAIKTVDDMAQLIQSVDALSSHHNSLYTVICSLCKIFVTMEKKPQQKEINEGLMQGMRYVPCFYYDFLVSPSSFLVCICQDLYYPLSPLSHPQPMMTSLPIA